MRLDLLDAGSRYALNLFQQVPLKLWGALAVMSGVLAGVGLYTFVYAEGFSYFSSDPKACVNCHIMRNEYDSWQKASHHNAAVCVDCHLPHTLIPKLIAKSDNGWRHSKAFTLQDFHEPIQITWRNSKILQDNCERCHGALVQEMLQRGPRESDRANCVKCHDNVGHGPRK
jgi:cytochrome c nitrite reductase small subunit